MAGCGTPVGFVQRATADDTVGVESMFICVVAAGYQRSLVFLRIKKLNKLTLLFINWNTALCISLSSVIVNSNIILLLLLSLLMLFLLIIF